MLKRLELIGFKSFADKTEFHFGPGITAIVGPNGSGKSNVVDAIRWILGEQSAKSLRGGEMTDVIFNGSATRKALGMAEVALTLDNTRRLLPIEADEVHIARRVYRDGEGEYLINRQPARLRDIKELFLGSGAGADAYAIIAQGKVDALLQASNQERRLVFEEAAGISRFRAKRQETLRKLEHVEQHLAQARTILDELRRQQQAVQLQAAKAERAREYQAALKERRLQLALLDYHHWHAQLVQAESALAERQRALAELTAQLTDDERRQQELEERLADVQERLQQLEADYAATRERLASLEQRLRYEQELATQGEAELAQTQNRLASLEAERLSAETALAAAESAAVTGQAVRDELAAEVERCQQRLTEASSQLSAIRQHLESRKQAVLDAFRESARLHNEGIAVAAHLKNLQQHRLRLEHKHGQAQSSLEQADLELRTLEEAERTLHTQVQQQRQALNDLRTHLEQWRQQQEQTRAQLQTDRERRSSLAAQWELLSELDRSHEGMSAGVRQVLAWAQHSEAGPWQAVLGVVADWLTVADQHAHLIDLLLGEKAQWLLVRSQAALAAALASLPEPLAGRVAFLTLDGALADRVFWAGPGSAWTGPGPSGNRLLSASLPPRVALPVTSALPSGVIAPATELVACSHPDLPWLPELLLGGAYLVADLESAWRLRAEFPLARFVTLAGELVEPRGLVQVGPVQAAAGPLARKADLRRLAEEKQSLDQRLQAAEQQLLTLGEQIHSASAALDTAEQRLQASQEQLVDLHARVQHQRQRSAGMAEELQLHSTELGQLLAEIEKLEQERIRLATASTDQEATVAALQAEIHALERDVAAREASRDAEQEQATRLKVALAQAEERCRTLQAERQRAADRLTDLHRTVQEQQRLAHDWEQRLTETAETVARLRADLLAAAELRSQQEQQAADQRSVLAELANARTAHQSSQAAQREHWQRLQTERHQQDLRAAELRLHLETVVQRVRDDWGEDLTAHAATFSQDTPLPDRAALEQEIDELRRKLNRLGSVNLDAIDELRALETRLTPLQQQHDDLVAAQKSLLEIIDKINTDSRRLLQSTFESVRSHFREIFRKLFGGGMADIVLENPDDILESGIEIIARPPGKEARHLQLLSGGEKSLTATALLLAIFRDKPSPFCVMDEVDAALDEANVGRFAALLREFCDRSQFIIVSHSKKTIAAADVIYGVTMEEAGVSKRVALRLQEAESTAWRQAA
jgi:chromosome segregation protein